MLVNFNKNARYIKYLCHFHFDQDFFECHEILEEQWKLELNNEYKKVWLGLIRLSVVLYHYRRGNFTGAKKLMRHVNHFAQDSLLVKMAGIDHEKFNELVSTLQVKLENEDPYDPITLPISDRILLNQFHRQKKFYSTFTDDLINKHSTRDRTDVISERLKQLKLRKK